MSGHWDALDANMALYRFHVQQISGYFDGSEFHHIPRAENEAADVLSKLGSSRQAIPPGVALEHLRKPSIKPSPESESIRVIPASQESEAVPMDIDSGVGSSHLGTDSFTSGVAESHSGTPQVMSAEHISAEPMDIDVEGDPETLIPTWAQPIFSYLKDGTLPSDETLARKTTRRAKAYTIMNKELYKRSVTSVLQRCISSEQGQEILLDIHQGECGHHASSRALVSKEFRHGFYWPSALVEA